MSRHNKELVIFLKSFELNFWVKIREHNVNISPRHILRNIRQHDQNDKLTGFHKTEKIRTEQK